MTQNIPANDTAPALPAPDLSTLVLRHWLTTTGERLFSVAIGRKSEWYAQWGFPNGAAQSLPKEALSDPSTDPPRYRPRGEVLTWFLDAMESLAPVLGLDLNGTRFYVDRSVSPSAGTYREGIALLRSALSNAGFSAARVAEAEATPTRLEPAGSSDE